MKLIFCFTTGCLDEFVKCISNLIYICYLIKVYYLSTDLGQYKFDNVNERDFLRTEGDPGAGGYTIKEAVSLVRSMVSTRWHIFVKVLIFCFSSSCLHVVMNGLLYL